MSEGSLSLTPLGRLVSRFSVQTPPRFWLDLYNDISAIAEWDGDWEQMVDERIAGLEEMKKHYYEMAAREL